MSEDDVLAQMRDIHMPAELAAAPPVEFASWPFVALAVVIAAILIVRLWRQRQWRRAARSELARIVAVKDSAAQWSMLLRFAASLSERARRTVALPALIYRRPETISDAERGELVAALRTELGR